MNYWTQLSIAFANQKNYLDELFKVYPLAPDNIRQIDEEKWNKVVSAYNKKDDPTLIKNSLSLDLFPIKDSYVAYLKRDKSAIDRNPLTIQRLCGRLYEMGIEEMREKCSQPKETNRQIGPLFRRWLQKKTLGLELMSLENFINSKENAVLDAGDAVLMTFAKKYLNYQANKGLDFVARMNNKYIIGEAKFLTDFGGHQDRQFDDPITLLKESSVKAIKIAILDGVLYIKGNHHMYKYLVNNSEQYNIMSSLLLREFLYQL